MPNVVVFDVIETLLDLNVLDPLFVRVFGDAGTREQWFQRALKTALTTTITGPYRDFGSIAFAALDMVAVQRGMNVTDDDKDELREALRNAPAHADVTGALSDLRGAGFRLATLSNNPRASSEAQIQNANLTIFFERVLSADDVQRLKPAPEPYVYAAEQLGVPTSGLWLVATHGWDIDGAKRAGCRTAFVARAGHVLSPLSEPPDVQGENLEDVARQIINAHSE